MVADLPTYRDWLIEGERDLEVQDFLRPEVLLGDWRAMVAEGVTLVIENVEDIEDIEDIDPGFRRDLAASFASDAVRLSIDIGHAHCAHCATGAPPVDYFVTHAGAMLAHIHLQDADGFADRHWPPGRGRVNWQAVFAAIAALPQRPHLVLELRDVADIPAAMRYLEREGLAH